MVNASKIEEDFAWLHRHIPPGSHLELSNRSDRFAALAVQGPRAPEVFAAFFGPGAVLPARFGVAVVPRDGLTFLVARTGYTGEDGFEWFFPARAAEVVWDELLSIGAPFGLIPCGLGARDSLRLEVCYPLNGSDLSPARTPVAAGLGVFVDLKEKGDFVGRAALLREKENGGPAERLAAFRMTEKSPPAPLALSRARAGGRRRARRRDDQRRPGPQPGLGGHRPGLRADQTRPAWRGHPDRHPRPALQRRDREETLLQAARTRPPAGGRRPLIVFPDFPVSLSRAILPSSPCL